MASGVITTGIGKPGGTAALLLRPPPAVPAFQPNLAVTQPFPAPLARTRDTLLPPINFWPELGVVRRMSAPYSPLLTSSCSTCRIPSRSCSERSSRPHPYPSPFNSCPPLGTPARIQAPRGRSTGQLASSYKRSPRAPLSPHTLFPSLSWTSLLA